MRFYLVMTCLVAALVGGYRMTEMCRQLGDFHGRHLEGWPRATCTFDACRDDDEGSQTG